MVRSKMTRRVSLNIKKWSKFLTYMTQCELAWWKLSRSVREILTTCRLTKYFSDKTVIKLRFIAFRFQRCILKGGGRGVFIGPKWVKTPSIAVQWVQGLEGPSGVFWGIQRPQGLSWALQGLVGPSKNLQRYFWDSFRTFKAQLWAKREEFYPWELLQYPPHDPSIHLGPAGLGLVLCKKVAKLGKSLTHDFLADMVSLHTNVNENRILTVSWHWVTPYLTRPKRDQYMMYREFSFRVIRFLL